MINPQYPTQSLLLYSMNHSHMEMNLCFFSIEFARQFGGVGRFPLQQKMRSSFFSQFWDPGVLRRPKRKATSTTMREFRDGLASFWGLPEIRSPNLIHDHQVFFLGSSLKRMRREAKPCWHSAVLQTDVRWQQC